MHDRQFITKEEWDHIPEEGRQLIAMAIAANRDNVPCKSELSTDSFYAQRGKRILDLAIGIPAFIVFLPVNALVAIVTLIDVGRPILFVQERIGYRGLPFKLYKFRNMTNETNEEGILLPPDERVTKWGKFVRRTSLDELMNLWSVVKGDMSIIGPRPLPIKYSARFDSYHQMRQFVRPGLECPFHSKELAKTGWQGRLDNDVWYVEHLSFSTDLRMFFLLIKKVFSKTERAESASGRTGEFMGYCKDGRVMSEWEIPREYLEVLEDKRWSKEGSAEE